MDITAKPIGDFSKFESRKQSKVWTEKEQHKALHVFNALELAYIVRTPSISLGQEKNKMREPRNQAKQKTTLI